MKTLLIALIIICITSLVLGSIHTVDYEMELHIDNTDNKKTKRKALICITTMILSFIGILMIIL